MKYPQKIHILVTSWHEEERQRIIAILSEQKDFFIAGIEKDESGAIMRTDKLKPDVLILDLRGMDSYELAPIIRRRSPSTAIVLLCDNDEESYVSLALKAGITGFILKKIDIDILAFVVRIVVSGRRYVSPSIISNMFKNAIPAKRKELKEQIMQLFTPAERRIIAYIAGGFSYGEIAKLLNYSEGSIKNCVMNIKRKTKLRNRVQIALYSLIFGLIEVEQLGFLGEIVNGQFPDNTIK
jgi:two-component system nitrate/nitrite response regulator NarL